MEEGAREGRGKNRKTQPEWKGGKGDLKRIKIYTMNVIIYNASIYQQNKFSFKKRWLSEPLYLEIQLDGWFWISTMIMI